MTTDTEKVTTGPEKASRWEDFIDVIFSPGELFDRRANEGWFKPFLILCAVCAVLYYVLLPVTGDIWEAMMRENAPPNVTDAQVAQSAQVMKWFYGIMMVFGFFFVVLISAVVIKLVSSLLEPTSTWRQAFLISTYSMFVTVPQTVLIGIAAFVKTQTGAALTTGDASFGVLRFTGPVPDVVVRTLYTRLDLFAVWSAALVAIGLIHVVRMPRGKAILTAVIVWALIALPGLAGAAFSQR
jgi:hypothetical protein